MKKSARIFIILLTISLILSGCGKVFENPEEKYNLVAVEAADMEKETYYVKNGTKFYKVYFPSATFNRDSVTEKRDVSRLCWIGRDESLIPSYYKGEVLAYSSDNLEMKTAAIERFLDCGYSFGIYGARFEKNQIVCDPKLLISDSTAAAALSKTKSNEIRIVTIDNIPVTSDMLDAAGVFIGLDAMKSYEVAYYAGTYYNTVNLTADRRIFESFETYTISKAQLTKNGFIAINMPEDAKAGWYMINGQGLFKYYDFSKGSKDIATVNMNEAYYLDAERETEEYTQQYLISIPEKTTDLAVKLEYETGKYKDADIKILMKSPNGVEYTLTGEDGLMSCMLAEAMAGKWTVAVYPKDLTVNKLYVESARPESTAVSDSFAFTIEEDQNDIMFWANYTGSSDVWGYVVDDLGNTTPMLLDEKNKRLYCTFIYLPEGKYTVSIYHYSNTLVSKSDWGRDDTGDITEIITVTE